MALSPPKRGICGYVFLTSHRGLRGVGDSSRRPTRSDESDRSIERFSHVQNSGCWRTQPRHDSARLPNISGSRQRSPGRRFRDDAWQCVGNLCDGLGAAGQCGFFSEPNWDGSLGKFLSGYSGKRRAGCFEGDSRPDAQDRGHCFYQFFGGPGACDVSGSHRRAQRTRHSRQNSPGIRPSACVFLLTATAVTARLPRVVCACPQAGTDHLARSRL